MILAVILIAPTHIFSPPLFMPFRFPYHLEMMSPFMGISWPTTFKIYHLGLISITSIGSINILGILFYPKFKTYALASSFIGSFLTLCIILFFFFPFMKINIQISLIYGTFSIVLFTANMLTFLALEEKRRIVKPIKLILNFARKRQF